jgi:hypothetical protein
MAANPTSTPPATVVQASPSGGLGLFATRDFAIGDRVAGEAAQFLSHVRDAAHSGITHEKHNDRFAWSLLERLLEGFEEPATEAVALLASWTADSYATRGAGHNWEEEDDERALAYLIEKSGLPHAVVRGLYLVVGSNAITASLTKLPLPLPSLDHADYALAARQKAEIGSEHWPAVIVARTFGFFPHLSRVNHSCTPNVTVRLPSIDSDGPIELCAIESIAAGSEVTYNYIGVGDSFKEFAPVLRTSMRTQLYVEYGFRCKCVECVPLCSLLLCSSVAEKKCPCKLGARYCGEQCQRLDWKRHREACKAARARAYLLDKMRK